MLSLTSPLRSLAFAGRTLARVFGRGGAAGPGDARAAELLAAAERARAAGKRGEALGLYRDVLGAQRNHLGALRGLRDLLVEAGRWSDALQAQLRILGAAGTLERGRETEWIAVLHAQVGREELAAGRAAAAVGHFKSAARADRTLVAAVLGLGEAQEAAGDHREAMRTWERGAESRPSLALLARLERAYREEGRPARMIEMYRHAVARAPDDLSLALGLGRVYLELEMLDEAADQLEKVEVRAPDEPAVHALLGAVFERRGDTREAFEEYRRALRLAHAFDWPLACAACGARSSAWAERCPTCRRFNTLGPAKAPGPAQ